MKQCDTSADCPITLPVCVDKLCVAQPGTGTDVLADSEEPAKPCVRHRDCDQTQPQVCSAGFCRKLTSAGCPSTFPDIVQDGMIPIAIWAGGVETQGEGPKAAVLGLGEINPLLPRQLIAVFCNKASPNINLTDEIDHLVGAGVPLIVGQFETTSLVGIVDRGPQIAIWSTLANSPNLQKKRNVWFLIDELGRLGPAYQPVFDRAEQLKNGGPDAGPTRVAMVVGSLPEDVALAASLEANLNVNDAGGPTTDPNFRRYAPADLADASAFAPHVVLAVGGDEMMASVVPTIEAAAAAQQPAFILSSRSRYNSNSVLKATSASNSLRARLLGVDFEGNATFHASFAGKTATPVRGFDLLYDAMFVTGFAANAGSRGRDVTVTADDMSQGLALLVAPSGDGGDAGDVPEVLIDNVADGVTKVANKQKFRLVGSTGPWIFDEATHSRRMGSSMFCIRQGTQELNFYLAPDAGPPECQP